MVKLKWTGEGARGGNVLVHGVVETMLETRKEDVDACVWL